MSVFYRGGIAARLQRQLIGLIHSLYADVHADPARTIFLCGAGRSGTTWLAELLNHDNRFRLLYEPFNCAQVPECKHFAPRQYLRSNNDDPRYLKPAREIFTGRIRNAWIDQYNRRIFPGRRLIKDVRSTLMLKWVREHFPQMPIVFLVRHPCAVALSRVRLAPLSERRRIFLDQPALVSDYLAPLVDEIQRANTPFEKHLIGWCIEHVVPFSQLNKGDVYLIFYENICARPREELEKLFSFLEEPFEDAVLMQLDKPSATFRADRAVNVDLRGNAAAEKWRHKITDEELSTAFRITRLFGLHEIYGSHTFPDVERAEALLTKAPATVS